MSEADTVAERVRRDREFEFIFDGRRYRLRTPTPYDLRVCSWDAGVAEDGRVNYARAIYLLVRRSLIGWYGPTVGDVLPGAEGADVPLPLEGDLVDAYLQDRLDLVDAIEAVLRERRETREAALKNSASASPGS